MRDAFADLLSLEHLGYFLVKDLVTLLADLEDLGTLLAELLDILEYLLGDLGRGLVLGETVEWSGFP